MSVASIDQLPKDLADRTPQDILSVALEHYDNIGISFSGAEDVVLIDMAVRIRPDVHVFSLDTGRLHAETYEFIERVRTAVLQSSTFEDNLHVARLPVGLDLDLCLRLARGFGSGAPGPPAGA